MKTSAAFALGLTALIFGGCVVSSVFPFYTEKDVVFEPALLGSWTKAEGGSEEEVWKFDKAGDRSYRFTLIQSQNATVMEGHAFKLEELLFLDVFSMDQDVRVIPPHYLFRVSQTTPTLKLVALDNERMRAFLAKDPSALAHHLVKNSDNPEDVRVVLTASTADLQRFIRKHLKGSEVWADEIEFKHQVEHRLETASKAD